MENFDFYSPTYFCFGDGAEKNTGALVRQFGGTKVLVVTGGGSIKRNGVFDAVIASLNDAELPWVELSGIQPNPLSDKVYEGIDLLRKEGCDFLLAIGGGSVGPIDESTLRYRQTENLSAMQTLPKALTVHAYNCWTKERYETQVIETGAE